MALIVHDPLIEADLKRQRAATGADRFDEVWNGVYFVSPQPNDEHQDIVTELIVALHAVIVDVDSGQGPAKRERRAIGTRIGPTTTDARTSPSSWMGPKF